MAPGQGVARAYVPLSTIPSPSQIAEPPVATALLEPREPKAQWVEPVSYTHLDVYKRQDLNPVRGREQAGLRPVLILSHDLFNRKSETAIAIAITSQPRKAGFPLTLALPADMLPKSSWVKISQIRTISVDRLGKRITSVDSDMLGQLVDGLLELIG